MVVRCNLFYILQCNDIKNACFTIEFSSFSHRYEKYFKAFYITNIWIGNLSDSPLVARFDVFRFNPRYCLQNCTFSAGLWSHFLKFKGFEIPQISPPYVMIGMIVASRILNTICCGNLDRSAYFLILKIVRIAFLHKFFWASVKFPFDVNLMPKYVYSCTISIDLFWYWTIKRTDR